MASMRRLYAYHWIGVAITAVGLALVGASAVLGGGQTSAANASQARFGIVLVILAQVFSAFQFVC